MIIEEIMRNEIILTAILAWAIAQLLKVFTNMLTKRTLDLSRLVGAGGMPSSHSALVMALTVSIGYAEGFHSSIFAVSTVLSMIVMYDAAGVRRAAGQQAAMINRMLNELEEHGLQMDKRLIELLGHTPTQVVAGAILGILIAVLRQG